MQLKYFLWSSISSPLLRAFLINDQTAACTAMFPNIYIVLQGVDGSDSTPQIYGSVSRRQDLLLLFSLPNLKDEIKNSSSATLRETLWAQDVTQKHWEHWTPPRYNLALLNPEKYKLSGKNLFFAERQQFNKANWAKASFRARGKVWGGLVWIHFNFCFSQQKLKSTVPPSGFTPTLTPRGNLGVGAAIPLPQRKDEASKRPHTLNSHVWSCLDSLTPLPHPPTTLRKFWEKVL